MVVTLEVSRREVPEIFDYRSLCDVVWFIKKQETKVNAREIKDEELGTGGGIKILLKRSVLNANHPAYIYLGYFRERPTNSLACWEHWV